MSVIANTYVSFRHISCILVSDRGHDSRMFSQRFFDKEVRKAGHDTAPSLFRPEGRRPRRPHRRSTRSYRCARPPPAAAPGAGGGQEFSLSFATSNTIESPFQVLAENYMKSHPNVKITFNPQPNDSYDQTLRTQLQAGQRLGRRSHLARLRHRPQHPAAGRRLGSWSRLTMPPSNCSPREAPAPLEPTARCTARRRKSRSLPWSVTRRLQAAAGGFPCRLLRSPAAVQGPRILR